MDYTNTYIYLLLQEFYLNFEYKLAKSNVLTRTEFDNLIFERQVVFYVYLYFKL